MHSWVCAIHYSLCDRSTKPSTLAFNHRPSQAHYSLNHCYTADIPVIKHPSHILQVAGKRHSDFTGV